MGIDSHLIDTCDIQRPTVNVTDSYGADKLRWPPDVPNHLTGALCRRITKSQKGPDTGLAESPVITIDRLLLPAGTDIQKGDRVVNITDEAGEVDPGPYYFEEVIKRRGRAQRHISILLEQR